MQPPDTMGEFLNDLPPLREVINANGLIADKKFGQNFLLDSNVTDKIARHADRACGGLSDKHVIEIGPGPGGLTRSLLKAGAKSLTAVEFDPRVVGALQGLKEAADGRLEIVEADALELDLTTLCDHLCIHICKCNISKYFNNLKS